MKIRHYLVAALLLTLVIPSMVSASPFSAEIEANPFGVQAAPKVGEKIQFTVHVQNTGTITLNGFMVKYKFLKPGGTWTPVYQQVFNDVLAPGAGVYKTIKTDIVADVEGYWSIYVYLYTSDGKTSLSSDSATFQVSAPQYQGTITITNIAGYIVAGAAILGLAAVLMRRGA